MINTETTNEIYCFGDWDANETESETETFLMCCVTDDFLSDDLLFESEKECFINNKIDVIKKKKTKYCTESKKRKITKSTSKHCAENSCQKYPSFNFQGNITPKYCLKHKHAKMINVRAKRCATENCTLTPSFNFSTKISPLYCFEHKHHDMINIKSRQCVKQSSKC